NDAWFVGYTPHLSASVWVGYPNALIEMRSVHGISVAGGTFPAQIWRSFMDVAKGADCDSFRPSVDTPEFSPFYGKYSSTGTSSDTTYSSGGSYTAPAPEGPGDNSAGGDDYSGYDPRLYESPPQEAPEPPPAPEPDDGGASPPGGGQGNGGGDRGGRGDGDGGDD
ncbi:MAG: penicillin-binding protein, partial [Thermoleophilaceae bacterium]|nr:penicillin-binding protein [Thermoleophilaceae bacterium]